MKSCNRFWNFYAKLLKFKNLSKFKSTGLILRSVRASPTPLHFLNFGIKYGVGLEMPLLRTQKEIIDKPFKMFLIFFYEYRNVSSFL